MNNKCIHCGKELEYSYDHNPDIEVYRCYECELGIGTTVLIAKDEEVARRAGYIELDSLEEQTYDRLADIEYEKRLEELSEKGETLNAQQSSDLKEECRDYVEEQFTTSSEAYMEVNSEIRDSAIEDYEDDVARAIEKIEEEKEELEDDDELEFDDDEEEDDEDDDDEKNDEEDEEDKH